MVRFASSHVVPFDNERPSSQSYAFLTMSDTIWYQIIIVWLHLVGATFWVGGMLFLSLVAAPLVRRGSGEVREWFVHLARRFRSWVWGAVVVLVGTGSFLLTRHVSWAVSPFQWPGIVQAKLGMVIVLLGLSIIHDRVVGPRVREIARKDRSMWTPCERTLLRLSPWLARMTLVSGLVILFLGIALARL
ncbi:MAG: hypothetical protein D6690_07370 [Nitrospirae bacterium]|nr:MAG: hypothetical protein D6690_07370 [Nitrospirota bacterium]